MCVFLSVLYCIRIYSLFVSHIRIFALFSILYVSFSFSPISLFLVRLLFSRHSCSQYICIYSSFHTISCFLSSSNQLSLYFFFFFFYFIYVYYSEENSDVLHFDYKQYRQSMVNLDSGNNCYYVDKNLLQITNTNSCEVIASSAGTGDANIHTSCTNRNCRNNHILFGDSNKVKKNLSESCVIDATKKSSSSPTAASLTVHKRKYCGYHNALIRVTSYLAFGVQITCVNISDRYENPLNRIDDSSLIIMSVIF